MIFLSEYLNSTRLVDAEFALFTTRTWFCSYTLCCFGGAGGQHACQVADALGMESILLHPFSGVLSAYGMGLVRPLRACLVAR